MESTTERKETTYGPPVCWKSLDDRQPRLPSLRVILHKSEYVLPWGRFLFAAENDAGDLVLSFATHHVLINGFGLTHLMADIAAQRVVSLHEPYRIDIFRDASKPEPIGGIREISVRALEEE